MAELGNQWEELRKRARQLENEIDLKLVSFSKLGTSFTNREAYNPNSANTPLLNKSNSDHMFETMAMEIEQLLATLTGVNDKLSDYASSLSVNSHSAALLHTLQRHRDILQDYSHEFTKTKTNITACRQRDDLLGSVRRDIDAYKTGMNRRTDLLLKENEHIRNSERLVDEHIGIAMATRENLAGQKSALQGITQKMTSLAIPPIVVIHEPAPHTYSRTDYRFPVINSLVQRINLRKRRDALILGGVIAGCLILLIMYSFS